MAALTYSCGDQTFIAHLHTTTVEPRPGILVLHGGTGITDHERAIARRLADLGYAALVPDLFGGPFTSREQAMAVIGELVAQPPLLRARVASALALLRARSEVDASRTAAIGYCFGGLAALELARSGADVACVVSFHGGLQTRAAASAGRIRARVLVCTGAADAFVPREQRTAFEDEMTAAGAAWQVHVYGGALHGFTEQAAQPRPGCAYNATADRQSWCAMRELLEHAFAA